MNRPAEITNGHAATTHRHAGVRGGRSDTTLLAGCDIWFGPGGPRGVFGAGVAEGLQDGLEEGRLSATGLRLFGSSIGCLNAVFLATGNTRCGLSIFQQDVRRLLRYDNLWPGLAARASNQMRRWSRRGGVPRPVPPLVDIDHVLEVMGRRAPEIIRQLRQAIVPVHSEWFDQRRQRYRHVDLRRYEEPLEAIRGALSCHPFYCNAKHPDWLDSGIRGPGFVDLLREGGSRGLVVVLNSHPTRRVLRYVAADIAAAALAASLQVSPCYLGKQWRLRAALRELRRHRQRVLLIHPPAEVSRSGADLVARLHAQGRVAADAVRRFVAESAAESIPPEEVV